MKNRVNRKREKILIYLYYNQNVPNYLASISRKVDFTYTNLRKAIFSLESKGLLNVEHTHYQTLVSLTDSGKKLAKSFLDIQRIYDNSYS